MLNKYIILFVVSFNGSLSSSASSDYLTDVSYILKYVETKNNTDAVGDGGRAFGILQIHWVAIQDVNRYYGTHYTHKDAFDEVCSEEIFILYISMGIRRYLKRNWHMPSEKRIVQFWNFGIYQNPYNNGYYNKYLKAKKLLCQQ